MGDPFDIEMARERREELLREAEGRRLAAALRKARRDAKEGRHDGVSRLEGVEVCWGLVDEESAVADLLELNSLPRWIAFEGRFVVAKKDGKMLGALRYRTESKRPLLGLLVVDPWAGEERVARALYRGAGELAEEMGVGEVVVSVRGTVYPGGAGYRSWGRGWRLDVARRSGPNVRRGPLAMLLYRPFRR